MQTDITENARQGWFMVSTLFYNFNLYLILVFVIQLTKVLKPTWYVFLVLSVPVVCLSIITINVKTIAVFSVQNYVEFIYSELAYKFENQVSVVNLFYLFISSIFLAIAYNKSEQLKFKKQVLLILITLILSVVLAFISSFDWSGIHVKRIPGTVLFYSLFWIFGIWYSLVKYLFLTLDTATISQDIISGIDEMVVLLDPDFHILTVNPKLKETINSQENLYGKHISCLIHEHVIIEEELKKYKAEEEVNFSCRINLVDQEENRICVDAKIKMIKDKFKDITGYLIIANEIKELKHLHEIYKITCREANVIQSVIAGRKNHEIAEELGITERTVKSHLTHIFNKLAVNNRIQLLIKLKDFNLIPEGQADKILFLGEAE